MDGFGAFILGRNMFGPVRGAWPDDGWKGWWGGNPPYHTPTFILTHHAREPIVMHGGTPRRMWQRPHIFLAFQYPVEIPGVTNNYQWLRNGGAIAGAKTTSYLVTTSDLGKTLVQRVHRSAMLRCDREMQRIACAKV